MEWISVEDRLPIERINVKRIGKFYMDDMFMRSDDAPEVFKQMAFVPYRVEMHAYGYKFECIGISHLFEPVADGFIAPEYNIEITKDDQGNITVNALAI